jgi:hypothetical protein
MHPERRLQPIDIVSVAFRPATAEPGNARWQESANRRALGHTFSELRIEAVPQLAYVAFEMMRTGRQTATERELLHIIEECRQNVPMIRRYTKDAPDEFLKRVELRSSLVVEAGHVAEGGKTVPFYQFRHLTFREYLAAVAAVEGHHRGYRQGETLFEPLGDVIVAEEWKEIIPMAAVLGRKQAQPLITELVSLGEAAKREFLSTAGFPEKNRWSVDNKLPAPISRLVQCLIEEAEVSQETLGETLSLVSFFARGCHGPENWQALSRGPYGKELIHQALTMYMEMNWPPETRLRTTVALLSALNRLRFVRSPRRDAATIRPLSSSDHVRRPPTPVITSSRRMPTIFFGSNVGSKLRTNRNSRYSS